MLNRAFSRLGIIAVCLLLAFSAAGAQGILGEENKPPSAAQGRGSFEPPVPFYIPPEFAPSARASYVTTSTTNDEDDGECGGGAGVSLREALTYCVAGNSAAVFVTPGMYILNNVIDVPEFASLTIVGASSANTYIEMNYDLCTDCRALSFTIIDTPLTVMNLYIRNATGFNGYGGGGMQVGGHGTFNLYNMYFYGNTAFYGGAVAIETDGGPILASLLNLTFERNSADNGGGAVAFVSTSSGSSLLVSDSTFEFNQATDTSVCEVGGGAIAMDMYNGFGDALTIENSSFNQNSVACGAGGAVYVHHDDGAMAVAVNDSEFTDNDAGGDDSGGGAIYIDDPLGSVQIQQSDFTGNQADLGGALNVDQAARVAIDESSFRHNSAAVTGGGMLIESNASISITYSLLAFNDAQFGGGAFLVGDPVSIVGSEINSNAASENGGGLMFSIPAGMWTVQQTFLLDNTAPAGPDCYVQGEIAPVVSLGGNRITSTDGCGFYPSETDEVDNMLLNGGFEQAQMILRTVLENKPAFWSVKTPGKGKRVCRTDAKPLKAAGRCAFVFTGSTGAKASLTQTWEESFIPVFAGDYLLLSAYGMGGKPSKVQLDMTVFYSLGLPAKVKVKTGFSGTTGGRYIYRSVPHFFHNGTIAKIVVKVTDKSKSGKFYLDSVFVTYHFGAPRAAAEGGLLPPPSAPAGMRGGN